MSKIKNITGKIGTAVLATILTTTLAGCAGTSGLKKGENYGSIASSVQHNETVNQPSYDGMNKDLENRLTETYTTKKKGTKESFDFYVGVYAGKANYEWSNCIPECGVDNIPSTNVIGVMGGGFYTGLRDKIKVDPGLQIDWLQTTDLHSHEVGAMDNRILSFNFLLRLPLKISDKFPNGRLQPYIGGGLGADWTKINTKYGNGDCNHHTETVLGGVRYFVSENVSIFGEYRNTKTEHHNFIHDRSDISIKQSADIGIIGIARHF